jgi:hypothetical protein
MKIAIIGGGWIGCHLANKFGDNNEITIYEKNSSLFEETSYKNQNRLHLGYHYARSHQTRKLCLSTFDRFIDDYGFAVEEVDKNLYCIANDTSLLDFQTYLKIFDDYDHKQFVSNFENFEGCINTDEKYINYEKVHSFFNSKLKFEKEKIDVKDLDRLSNEFDIVINATNNHISDKSTKNSFYELAISLIYEKKSNTNFDALTVVDGNLFSIYPYQNNLFTVTDVEHTPIKKFFSVEEMDDFIKNEINEGLINDKKTKIETKVLNFYKDFLMDFEYKNFFISTKSKINVKSDSRYPIITQSGNIVNCFTGKIQGIYLIEDYIKTLIDEKTRTN